jgi:hypothetical protein
MSRQFAARTPNTLFAAMHMPWPVAQIKRPRSALPLPTASATRMAESG